MLKESRNVNVTELIEKVETVSGSHGNYFTYIPRVRHIFWLCSIDYLFVYDASL